MNVIIIAHNQFELVGQNIAALQAYGDIDISDIVIVDNASTDGLRAWLEESTDLNYLICDEGIESYAVILNTAIESFELRGDVLVLVAEYMIMPDTLKELQIVLHTDEKIGAVSGVKISQGSNKEPDYFTVLCYLKQQKERKKNKEKLTLSAEAILIKHEMIEKIGQFEEKLVFPSIVITDFLFRGLQEGFSYYECSNAYFYENQSIDPYARLYGTVLDGEVLREKWGMNYFNVRAHIELVNCVQGEKEEPLAILEIGCDCGANLLELHNRYPNAKCYGVEINESAAKVAAGVANVKIGNIEEENVEFEGIKFDYILFGDVLEHLHNPEKVIRYCRNLLKENGRIVASIPNLMHHSVLRGLINGDFTYTDMGLLDRTHIHFFTYNEIIKMFEQEQYVVENIEMFNKVETNEEEEFIDKLMSISEKAEPFMFGAFQYFVTARMEME